MPRLQIRPLTTLDDLRACERIQKSVWGNVGVTSEVLKVTAKYGGVVLGAAAGGRLVGFLYAFLARRRGRLIHWSHMMALEPRFRNRGLGLRMKLAHRRLALAQGIRSVCWTYDPLQSRNAALNIGRLGGLVDEYLEDCYGRFESRIEKGLPSDRFVVDWRVGSSRVARRLATRQGVPARFTSLPRVNRTRANTRGFLENRRLDLNLKAPRLAVEIPSDTDAMRAKDLRLAERWRFESRRIFTRYFACGYHVEDFVPPGLQTAGRCFYVLRRS